MLCRPLAGADNEQMSNLNFASLRLPTCHALRRRTQAGFSLMEVMVVAVIVAIMAVLAVPSFSGMVQRQRVKNAADAVLSDLRWARSEAIKRGQEVTVTFDKLKSNDWGYVISVNENGIQKIIKEKVTQSNLNGVILYRCNESWVCPDEDWDFTFDRVRGGLQPAKNGHVGIISTQDNNQKLLIAVSLMGRVMLKK